MLSSLFLSGVRGSAIAVVSLDRGKAAETKKAVEDIATASGLQGHRFLRSPAPGGRGETADGSELTILAGVEAGTAGGFDLVLIDEAGKMTEKRRGLIETCLGALAARAGLAVYLSIFGNGIFTKRLLDRADDDGLSFTSTSRTRALALTTKRNGTEETPVSGRSRTLSICGRCVARRKRIAAIAERSWPRK